LKIAEQLRGATATVKSSQAVQKVTHQCRTHGPWWIRQLLTVLLLLLVVIALLASLNWAQNRDDVQERLWGELAFFGLVIALGIAVVGTVLAWLTRLLPDGLRSYVEVDPIPLRQAFGWGALAVLAIPIAMMQWPEGFVVLIGGSVVFGLAIRAYVLRRAERNRARGSDPPASPEATTFAIVWPALLGLFLLAGYTLMFHGGPIRAAPLPEAEPVVPEAESLAVKYRPYLFFDSGERYRPVNIRTARMQGCPAGLGGGCSDPLEPSDSLSDYQYLIVERAGGRNNAIEADESAYYYHAVRRGPNIHLDYWWFYEHNPSPVGRNLLCGQALRWLGKACAEHHADWEGITVVLVPCEQPGTECAASRPGQYAISEVHYAQHEKVVSYKWDVLQQEWAELAELAASTTSAEDDWPQGHETHPFVFVARDSHASYAVPCRVSCDQIVHSEFEERRNGRTPWDNNDDTRCGSDCLQALPNEDGKPSAWNAFAGPWGPQSCILFGSYCDAQPAPSAPAFQKRFQAPECVDTRCLTKRGFEETAPGSGV
jgi:hypothetical protein